MPVIPVAPSGGELGAIAQARFTTELRQVTRY